MKSSLIILTLILIGCREQRNVDRPEKAINIPIQKIAYSSLQPSDSMQGRFEQEVILIKKEKDNQVELAYLDSLMGNSVKAVLTVFNDTADIILLYGDTCKRIGERQFVFSDTLNTVFIYENNLAGVVDEEAIIVLNEAKQLNIIWDVPIPYGRIHLFDHREKAEGYFSTLETELIHFKEEQMKKAIASKQQRRLLK